jgi:glycosyltransferase involved in cell wall biosynthesis
VTGAAGGGAKPLEVDVIIPARNEERELGAVLAAVPARTVRTVVVVDNASTDGTARVGEDGGAVVVREARVGYGAACLRGVAHLSTLPRPPDVVVFLSADGSDDPTEIPNLLQPLRENLFDLVIGSRVLGGAPLSPQKKAGNVVAVNLIRAIYGHRYTDLGPFRAIRYPALIALGMRDAGQGWLVEMQVKALKVGLRIAETPVSSRGGRSPGLGQRVKGTIGTSAKTLFQIFRHSTAR